MKVHRLNPPNIYLVGPMGAGKTTIGRVIADLLGRTFVDMDHEIERKTGASIPWIFEKEGEEGFRNRETSVLQDISQQTSLVVATGGGVIGREENRHILHACGTVVYLYTPVELQLQRTYRDKNRPLLQVNDPLATLQRLMQIRDPLYREVADFIVETNEGDAKELALQVLTALNLT